jgi:iron-sulfur cluster assembly protein
MHTPQVTVTPAAEKFMRRMVRFSDPERRLPAQRHAGRLLGLHVGVHRRGHAAGRRRRAAGRRLRLFLPATSRLLLDGVTVDFADTPTQSGLTFFNPNAEACGCSTADTAGPPAQATVSLSSIKRRQA